MGRGVSEFCDAKTLAVYSSGFDTVEADRQFGAGD
jgi:hypothetical protein